MLRALALNKENSKNNNNRKLFAVAQKESDRCKHSV